MFPSISPTQTQAWKKLQDHQQLMKGIQMKSLFHNDPNRFNHYSLELGEILFDYSKNLISGDTL